MVSDGRMRSNSHKVKHKMFHLNVRKNFFMLRATEHWKRLPMEVVESLEIFKSYLDTILDTMF